MRENSKGASELARRLAELEKTGFAGRDLRGAIATVPSGTVNKSTHKRTAQCTIWPGNDLRRPRPRPANQRRRSARTDPRVLVLCLVSSFPSQVCNHCNAHVIPLIDAHDNQGVREYWFRDWENAGTVVGGHRHMTPA